MREIEKSVYIAADAELLKCDIENSRDIGRTWGGASAGDFTGAAQVRACPTRLDESSRSSSLSGMRQGENGPIVPGRTPVQGQAQQGRISLSVSVPCHLGDVLTTSRVITSVKFANTTGRACAKWAKCAITCTSTTSLACQFASFTLNKAVKSQPARFCMSRIISWMRSSSVNFLAKAAKCMRGDFVASVLNVIATMT